MNGGLCVLAIVGLAVFFGCLFKRPVAQTLSTAVFAVTMALYALSVAGVSLLFSSALVVLFGCVFGVGGGSAFLFRNRSRDVRCKLKDDGLAVLVFACLCAGIFYACRGRLAMRWDEFSHWMLAVKNMHALNGLPASGVNNLLFPSYPPAMSLFEAFFGIFHPVFREDTAYAALDVFLLCILFAPAFNARNGLLRIVRLILLLAAPLILFDDAYISLYADCTLGVMFAHLLYLYFSEEKYDAFFVLNFCLSASVLVLIKSTGKALFLMSMVIILADGAFFRRDRLLTESARAREGKTGKRRAVFGCVLLLAVPLLVGWTWTLYMRFHGVAEDWQVSGITLEEILSLIRDPLPYQRLTAANFLSNMTGVFYLGKAPLNELIYPFCLALIVFAVAALHGRAKRGACVAANLVLVFAVYAVSLLVLYLFVYVESEAVGNASFSRYMNTMALGELLFGLYVLLDAFWQRERGDEKRWRKGYAIAAVSASALLVFLMGGAHRLVNAVRERPAQIAMARAYREPLQETHEIIRTTADAGKERVYFISIGGDNKLLYVAHLDVAPIMMSMYYWNISTAVREGVTYMPIELWSETLKDEYDYVYIECDSETDRFQQEYGALFLDPERVRPGGLYRVTVPAERELVQLTAVN